MKKLMTLLLGLTTYTVSAQFANPGFEEPLDCLEDCTLPNSQMTCVPGWDATSNGEIKYVQSINCENDIICTGNTSIFLSSDENEILGIETANPLPDPILPGTPELITLTTNVLTGSDPFTGIIISGKDGASSIKLGEARPAQQGTCEDMTILLDPDENPHNFPSLEFVTRSIGGGILTNHATVVDNIEHCGPLFTIDDNCEQLIFQLNNCNLESFISKVSLFVNSASGGECSHTDIYNDSFDDPVVCNLEEPGTYTISVGLFYNFNPDLPADLFTVTYEVDCCDEPIPDYIFVDENGDPKTEDYCFGEDVFIDASNSANEDRWFISIWQYNLGGLAAGEDHLEYCRINPDIPNLIQAFEEGEVTTVPLNPIWQECFGTLGFEPGFEYRVQLVVLSDCFPGWFAKEDEVFTVVCCDEFAADPRFIPDGIDFEEYHYTINAIQYDPFENLNAEHEWYVYTENDDGTFNQIAILTGPTFSFEPAEYGVEYFIIHKVVTACEEKCFRTCISNGGGGMIESGKRAASCLGMEVDCSIIEDIFPPCSELVAPTNLQVVDGMLTWTPVPGAVSYTVVGQIGGITACECGSSMGMNFTIGTTETNSIPVPDWLVERCFQWNVRASCEGGLQSALSKSACYYPVMLKEGHGAEARITAGESNISISPNPANKYFEIYNNTANEVSIELYNINGQLINTIGEVQKMGQVSVNTSQMAPGLYLIIIKDKVNNQLISSQKVIIQ